MRIVRRHKPDLERQLEALQLLLRSGVENGDPATTPIQLDSDLGRERTEVTDRGGIASTSTPEGSSAT